MLTADLGKFAATLSFDDLSGEAVRRTKTSIIDVIGCALAGSRSAVAASVRTMAMADGGAPVSLVFGSGQRLPPAAAALANGTAGHALDFDDSSPPMIGHPSTSLVPALLALAEQRGLGGRELIAAFVAGLEAGARLGRYLNPSHYAAGWHATATLGTLCTATGSSALLGLGEDGIRNAIGIAVSSASGIRVNFGSMVKPLHAGLAARNGVVAALLTEHGLHANPNALEGERGFIDVFGGAASGGEERPDLTGLRFDRERPEIVASGIGIKPYACCGCTHSAVDALLDLRSRHSIDAGAVASIDCTMNHLVPDILVYHRPETADQAKFSMEYCLAVSLLDGDCGIDQFTSDRVRADDVQRLLRLVRTSVDPEIAYRNGVYPATVTISLQDGRTVGGHAEEARGHPDRPFAIPDLRQKFISCATRALPGETAAAAFELLSDLERCADLRTLTDILSSTGDHR